MTLIVSLYRWPAYICDLDQLDSTSAFGSSCVKCLLTAYPLYIYKKNYIALFTPKEIKPYNDVMLRAKHFSQQIPDHEQQLFQEAINEADFEMTLNLVDRKIWKGWKPKNNRAVPSVAVVTPASKIPVAASRTSTPSTASSSPDSTESNNTLTDDVIEIPPPPSTVVTPTVTTRKSKLVWDNNARKLVTAVEDDGEEEAEVGRKKRMKVIGAVLVDPGSAAVNSNTATETMPMANIKTVISIGESAKTTPRLSISTTKSTTTPVSKYAAENDANSKIESNKNKTKIYIVDKLLEDKIINKRKHFKVLWKGFPLSEATWESRVLLMQDIPEMVEEYETEKKTKKYPNIRAIGPTLAPNIISSTPKQASTVLPLTSIGDQDSSQEPPDPIINDAVLADVILSSVPHSVMAGGFDSNLNKFYIFYYLTFVIPQGHSSAKLGLRLTMTNG